MISKARRKLLASLKRRDARIAQGLYLVEGRLLVLEALRSGAVLEEILVTGRFADSAAGEEVARAAALADVRIEAIAAPDLERLADTRTPQGVLAVVRRVEPSAAPLEAPGVVLVQDGVSDPGNVGTLIRAADAFGANAVLSGPGSADFENMKTLRAAMGSSFHVPLFRADDLPGALGALKADGARIFAATLDGEDPAGIALDGPRVVLVLGNEVRGPSPEVLAVADRRLTIPCPGRAESLNVAMAGSILLSHLSRSAGRGDPLERQ